MGIRPWVRIGCGCRLRAQYHCRLRCTTRPDRAARPDHGAGLSPCARNTIREATSQARPSRQHAEHAVRRNRTAAQLATFSGHRQHSRRHRRPEVWLTESLRRRAARPTPRVRACSRAPLPRAPPLPPRSLPTEPTGETTDTTGSQVVRMHQISWPGSAFEGVCAPAVPLRPPVAILYELRGDEARHRLRLFAFLEPQTLALDSVPNPGM